MLSLTKLDAITKMLLPNLHRQKLDAKLTMLRAVTQEQERYHRLHLMTTNRKQINPQYFHSMQQVQ